MNKPKLTVLNFSGGKQSSALLWMVLLGYLQVDPKSFAILNADPGMENSYTYSYIDFMRKEAARRGFEIITAPGPNLYLDILELPNTDKTRFDTPSYWTPGRKKNLGRLFQKCTGHYKVAPMDRMIRKLLWERFEISPVSRRIGENIVEKWIGFSYDEAARIKPAKQKYVYFRYPLIELGMTNEDVRKFFEVNQLPLPPRSVCNACFANGLDTLREMYYNRPADWEQAVKVDRSVRDWTQIGVEKPVYVSKTLLPLEKLAEMDFDLENLGEDVEEDFSCDSGYCFV